MESQFFPAWLYEDHLSYVPKGLPISGEEKVNGKNNYMPDDTWKIVKAQVNEQRIS